MTKKEFLGGLKSSLSGRVDTSVVAENINYYEDYINTQVRMGRSEAAVVKELGDPRLIARSIADASKYAGSGQSQESAYQSNGTRTGYAGSGYSRGEYAGGGYTQSGYSGNVYGEDGNYRKKIFKIPAWLIVGLVVLVVFLLFTAAFSLLSFLAPILLPLLFIGVIVKFLRNT